MMNIEHGMMNEKGMRDAGYGIFSSSDAIFNLFHPPEADQLSRLGRVCLCMITRI